MEKEKLTRQLVESHLMSFIEICSEKQRDGVVRWAWGLTEMAGAKQHDGQQFEYKFSSSEAATKFAIGWIKRNNPNLVAIAKSEALEGIRYRALKQ